MLFLKNRVAVVVMFLCGLASLGLVACHVAAQPQSSAPTLQVALNPAPEGVRGKYLSVQVMDQAGKPVTDATVSLEGNMSHGGMAPVAGKTVTDEADGKADGLYQVPFQFNMRGDWIITVAVKQGDGAVVKRDIPAQVSGQGVRIGK